MLKDNHCELCSTIGAYVFPNGETMCRAYYDYIINEYNLLSQLGIKQNVDN